MTPLRRYLMAASVIAIALATGYVMQHGHAVADRVLADDPGPATDVEAVPSGPEAPLLRVNEAGITDTVAEPSLPSDPEVGALPDRSEVRVWPPAPSRPDLTDQTRLSPFGLPCAIALTAAPDPAGMVALILDAPCYSNAAITLAHGALRATAATDATGMAALRVPALSTEATYSLRFDDGTEVSATTQVPGAEIYDHVVLQWRGRSALGLHALEYGASHGSVGHVHAGRPHGPMRALRQGGGFLTQLGDPAMPGGWLAEVYSFPVDEARADGLVEISIEAEITTASCGREVNAETIQTAHGGPDRATSLTLAMPGCAAIGDFLVLKNLLQDLRLATR